MTEGDKLNRPQIHLEFGLGWPEFGSQIFSKLLPP